MKIIKSIIFAMAITVIAVILTNATYAQVSSPSTVAKQVDEVTDLTFPLAELGNCADYKSCLTYCDDPVNNASCIEYAKKKGFYRDDPVIAPTEAFWEETEDALGCNSAESCLEFCSNEDNYDRCHEYADSEGIIGGYVEEPDKPEYLKRAKEILGCDSASACATFCDDPANASRCDQFADSVGLLGGQTQIGPGGCTSNETCDNFCRDPNNFSFCAVYSPPNQAFNGPGGCNSPESCRSHCEENPQDCRSYAPGSNGVYVPVSCPAGQFFGPGGVCTTSEKTQEAASCAQGGKFWNGSACQDQPPAGIHPTVGGAYYQPRPEMGNCSNPQSCYDYCKTNPQACPGFDQSSQRPQDQYIPNLYYTPGTEVKFAQKPEMGNCDSPGSCYDYCKENPGKCEGFDSKSPKPVDIYTPLTYYTPPSNYQYFTPPATSFYVTPIYYTPPEGSNYTTPNYYTPGSYYTPPYYTPTDRNYTTPNYYTPGSYYYTPSGSYPTPSYLTPIYYTPPEGSNYTTPNYYTPPPYTSPYYYTPTDGSYTTPSYPTPPPYNTPSYYTPPAGYSTPSYASPSYYSYPSPSGGTYPSPSYYYPTPGSGYSYPSPSYPTPSGYTYPTPSTYYSPSGYSYPSPSYGTPSYGTPSYGTPAYGTPSYGTPEYGTPSYGTPSYGTPPPYGTPSYGTPGTYATPARSIGGVSTKRSLFDIIFGKIWGFLK